MSWSSQNFPSTPANNAILFADPIWLIDSAMGKRHGPGQLVAHPGYCTGISVCWIMLRRQGLDFDTFADNQGRQVKFTDQQKMCIQFWQDAHVKANDGRDAGYNVLFDGGTLDDPFIIHGPNYTPRGMEWPAWTISDACDASNGELIGGTLTYFFL